MLMIMIMTGGFRICRIEQLFSLGLCFVGSHSMGGIYWHFDGRSRMKMLSKLTSLHMRVKRGRAVEWVYHVSVEWNGMNQMYTRHSLLIRAQECISSTYGDYRLQLSAYYTHKHFELFLNFTLCNSCFG